MLLSPTRYGPGLLTPQSKCFLLLCPNQIQIIFRFYSILSISILFCVTLFHLSIHYHTITIVNHHILRDSNCASYFGRTFSIVNCSISPQFVIWLTHDSDVWSFQQMFARSYEIRLFLGYESCILVIFFSANFFLVFTQLQCYALFFYCVTIRFSAALFLPSLLYLGSCFVFGKCSFLKKFNIIK